MLTEYIQTKGYTYEKYVYSLLKNDKKYFDNVWFFKYTPENIIAKTSLYDSYEIYSKYRNCDIGADFVGIKDDVIYFIQCKNYDNIISINDLSSFYFLLHEHNLNGYVFYNGTLSERINDLSKNKVPFINIPYNNQLIDKMLSQQNTIYNYETRDYQLNAVINLKNEKRSILNLPCGTGKTYTSYLITKEHNYKNIIIIAPTRTLTSELLHTMSSYYNEEYNPVLISMDGSRDTLHIKSILKNTNIIASTYDSVDILIEIINDLTNIFIIIDEYHNLSLNNLTNNLDPINKILESDFPILYLSATPVKKCNNNYFGDQMYKYTWTEAIKNKHICDFKIIIPEIKSYVDCFQDILTDLKYTNGDIKLVNKAYFLLRSMLYEGSTKCIVYLTSIKNADLFKNIIIWLQKLLNITVNTYTIDCNTAKTKRADYITKFKLDSDISLMLNIQILNEGIDIPICDSVFITDPNNNIENLIQRMSRANRIYLSKIECKIYMYCSENKINKILNYINKNTNNELKDKIYKIKIVNTNKPIEIKQNIKKSKNILTNNQIINKIDSDFDKQQINDIDSDFNNKINSEIDSEIINNINNIASFNTINFENNKIFVIIDNSKICWFNAKQICKSLNYVDTKHIITKHVEKEDKTQLKNININFKIKQQPDSIYINEIGLYKLLLSSRNKKSKIFMKWVKADILPKLRQQNIFSPDKDIINLLQKINDLENKNKILLNNLKLDKFPESGIVYVTEEIDENKETYNTNS
jgi:superfamily II DNA or RNA helicase/prophage antirepressor-like protein